MIYIGKKEIPQFFSGNTKESFVFHYLWTSNSGPMDVNQVQTDQTIYTGISSDPWTAEPFY